MPDPAPLPDWSTLLAEKDADPYAKGYISACRDIAAAIRALIPSGNILAHHDDADSK